MRILCIFVITNTVKIR